MRLITTMTLLNHHKTPKYAPILSLLLLFVTGFLCAGAQPVTGQWQGVLNVQKVQLPLVWHIQQKGDTLSASLDSPLQGAKGIPVDTARFVNNLLELKINLLKASFSGRLEGDSISGTFTQMGQSFPLVLKKGAPKAPERPQTPKPPFDYKVDEISFINPKEGNTLAGTLTTPLNKKQFPVVVLITGSGAQDRDETIFDHKPFWVIADHLTKNGIGVIRLDDRGVGGSSKGSETATSADFATDISAAVDFLISRGYKNIGLLGHSEGGMIAPIVAATNKNVKFIISMAGPGIAIEKLMLQQTFDVAKSMGASDLEAAEKAGINKGLYDFVKTYQGANFENDFRLKIEKALEAADDTKNLPPAQKQTIINQQVKIIASPWFRYFLNSNPPDYISKLKIPVLAINGNKDVQVNGEQNIAGWQASLKKARNKNFETRVLPGLNHLFQEAKTGSVDEYATINQTIAPQVLELITQWILKLK